MIATIMPVFQNYYEYQLVQLKTTAYILIPLLTIVGIIKGTNRLIRWFKIWFKKRRIHPHDDTDMTPGFN